MKFISATLAALTLTSGAAFAVPAYTTSVTVPYDPAAPSFCNPNCVTTNASNNSTYTIRTGADSNNFYADIQSTPSAGTDTSLQFSNIYFGGSNFTNNLVLEVTNSRVSTTDNPSAYTSLAGTGYSFSSSLNDISFVIPFAYFEQNPDNLNYGSVLPGDLLRISFSQSFGYSLVAGADFDPVTRLGAQFVPRSLPLTDVPEPASLALLGVGLAGIVAAGRRRAA